MAQERTTVLDLAVVLLIVHFDEILPLVGITVFYCPRHFSVDNTINYFVVDRYDMDFDDDVLYCYEIQLEADLMRQGLGRLVPFPVSISGFRFRLPFLVMCCVVDLLVL